MLSTSLVFCIPQNGVDANCGRTAKKWPQLHRTGWRLHHDNARPHVANHVMQFLAKFNITCVPHPPYNPDLAPCDFLFPSLKAKLRGIRFEISEAVLKKREAIIKDLTKNGLRHEFEEWQQSCKKCFQLEGDNLKKTIKSNKISVKKMSLCWWDSIITNKAYWINNKVMEKSLQKISLHKIITTKLQALFRTFYSACMCMLFHIC